MVRKSDIMALNIKLQIITFFKKAKLLSFLLYVELLTNIQQNTMKCLFWC